MVDPTRTSDTPLVGPLVEARSISKAFGGVAALGNVDLDLWAQEVHCVVGENGAGKSTLMRILAGVLPPDAGSIAIAGEHVRLTSPRVAGRLGVVMIHQELSLVPELSVAENMFLGMETRGRFPWLVDFKAMREAARETLSALRVSINPDSQVREMGMAQRQLVEVAKGLARHPRLLILDEPTSSLSYHEIEELLRLVRSLPAHGTAVLFVSHKLSEVLAIADRITVLRDGAVTATGLIPEWTESRLVKAMVGRDLGAPTVRQRTDAGVVRLSVQGLTRPGMYEDVSFELREGEVLGLAGIVGAGRSEVAEAVFGITPAISGSITIDGRPVRVRRPQDAIRAGVAMVPEDRRRRGLILQMSVASNMTLPWLRDFSRLFRLQQRREQTSVHSIMDRLHVRGRPGQPVNALSGGNQQKVVIGRWFVREPRVLILDEPTHGVDVGTKDEIYRMVAGLADQGLAVLLISSELPELLRTCDRILVMRAGRVVAEMPREAASEELIAAAATGGSDVDMKFEPRVKETGDVSHALA